MEGSRGEVLQLPGHGCDVSCREGSWAVGVSALTGEVWDGEGSFSLFFVVLLCSQLSVVCLGRIGYSNSSSSNSSLQWQTEDSGVSSVAVFAAHRVAAATDSGDVVLVAFAQQQQQQHHEVTRVPLHDDCVTSLAVEALSSSRLVSASLDCSARLLDTDTQRTLLAWQHAAPVTLCAAPSNTPATFVTACARDRRLSVWHSNASAASAGVASVPSLACTLPWEPSAICCSADAATLLAGSHDGDVAAFDLRNAAAPLWTKRPHKAAARKLILRSDNSIISAGDDGRVLAGDRLLCSHTDFVRGLGLLPDGTVISASWDKTVRFSTL